jgi:hypothetical protein
VGVAVSRLPESLPVEPGGEASWTLTIRNTGSVVDQFAFEALGDAEPWTELEPPTLSLFPDAEGELRLIFKPPRAPAPLAGLVPYAVRISSHEDADGTLVREGKLDVAPFSDQFAELVPRTCHGRYGGKQELAFDNRGNAAVNTGLSGGDPDGRLRFSFSPPALDAPPGSAAFATVRVHPNKRFFRGPSRTIPFQVQAQPDGGPPVTADGSFVQEALIPRWLLPALLALGLLAVLWALLLKPTIESQARDAVAEPLARQDAQLAQQDDRVARLENQADGGGKDGQTNPDEGGSGDGSPYGRRLQSFCGSNCQPAFAVPTKQQFSLTDIVLENPRGDSGTIKLRRGSATLLVQQLENFRSLDFHFVAPIVVNGGSRLILDVECGNGTLPGATQKRGVGCTPGAYLAGFLRAQASDQ